MATITCALFWALLPVFVLFAVLSWLSETNADRARRWRAAGWTQQRIADRLGVSRSTARRLLAA